mmetsp:Transcript_53990/g.126681  ORF Transcript_53990/g.126681 Transcript_53990/m.126681 type:complete len:241 (-) Transcript_53990:2146-2868(-)
MVCATQISDEAGGIVVKNASEANSARISFEVTWLCHSGKMSGTPVLSFALVTTPMTDVMKKMAVIARMLFGQPAMPPANVKRSPCIMLSFFFPAAFGLLLACGSCCTTDSEPLSPQEMSTVRALTAFSLRCSATTRSGGRISSTRLKANITQRPINIPNSRSGCSALAKLAKKLNAVVIDVARQLSPAWTIIHMRRQSMSLPLDCSQKSVKTNTTSQPIPVMRNTDKKDAIVAFSAGVQT